MKTGFFLLLAFSCSLSFADSVKPKYGPVAQAKAIPLSLSHDYFKTAPAPQFWSLISYYVPQMNGAACSAASVSMVINAALSHQNKTADDEVISQTKLLDTVKVEHWKERLSEAGFEQSHGVTLDQLGKIVAETFKIYSKAKTEAEVVHLDDQKPNSKKKLLDALMKLGKSNHDFMIANFDQESFTNDSHAGHISPVGAYDEKNKQVLILDPDRQYYEPYWISLDTFLEGLSTLDSGSKKHRGFVYIEAK